MTEEELLELLKRPESESLEFKEVRKEVPKTAYPTVSAFTNIRGGWLIFGVSDYPT